MVSNMSSANSSELRLRLIDSITDTIANFIDNGESEEEKRESRLSVEDLAEEIINDLRVKLRDGVDSDGSFVAVIQRLPEE